MTDSIELVVRRAHIGSTLVDLGVDQGRIVAVGEHPVRRRARREVDVGGGAVIPGLHDHHIHLLATAAAASSLDVGDPAPSGRSELAAEIARRAERTPAGEWIRVVGYHESIAGPLDASLLDTMERTRPLRVQHRSGTQWVCNTVAVGLLALERTEDPAIERREDGTPTGRIWRGDHLIRPAGRLAPHSVARLGQRLAALGVTSVTDATPDNDRSALALMRTLPQRVRAMGPLDMGPLGRGPLGRDAPVERAEVKIVLDDDRLPALDELEEEIRSAHRHDRSVAVHAVTRAQAFSSLAAIGAAGSMRDRLEHGSVLPEEAVLELARLGMAVVTQPGFVHQRGDTYLEDVEPDDVDHLYRARSLLQAGVVLGGSSDAPYADLDPWSTMAYAVTRTTRQGVVLGADEQLVPRQALALFRPHLWRRWRSLGVGDPADLVVLDAPLEDVLADLDSRHVVCTMIAGEVVWERGCAA